MHALQRFIYVFRAESDLFSVFCPRIEALLFEGKLYDSDISLGNVPMKGKCITPLTLLQHYSANEL